MALSVVLSKTFSLSSRRALVLLGMAAAGFASPAIAGSEPTTRVVRCGEQSCLQISGHRSDPASVVRINGQVVVVDGNRGWRVNLPVETVRQWSAPFAREIEISLSDPATQLETTSSVDLPIGLLGGLTDLSVLEVSVR